MLTQDFKASIQSGATPGVAGGVTPGQPMTSEQFQSWSGSSTSAKPNYLQRVGQDISQNVKEGGEALSPYMTGEKNMTNTPPMTMAADISGVAKNVSSPLWSWLTAAVQPGAEAVAKNPQAQEFGKDVSAGAEQFTQDIKPVGAIAEGIEAFRTAHPDAARALENLFQTGINMTAVPGAKAVSTGIKTASEALKPAAETAEAAATRQATEAASKEAAAASQIKKISAKWTEPTIPGKSRNPGSFKAATAILKENPDIPQFLAQQKLNPYDHIEGIKDPRYNTLDTGAALREDAGQLSRDKLRTALRDADYSTQKTPVSDIVKRAIAASKQDPLRTPGQEEKIANDLTKEAGALQRKYPNGMNLSQMHDNKISYNANGGYKPVGTADNLKATMNRNLGGALQKIVEEKAPPELDVGGFNKYLSNYYKAADYLDALNTKKVPVSLASDIMHRGASVAGAIVGHHITGGMLGGVSGYVLGGTLEHLIEHLSPGMRGQFLRDLKIAHPEALQQIDAFIAKEEAARGTRLALPPGKAPGEPGAPTIQLPAAKSESSVMAVPAQKNPLSVNPKTGKFQTSYSSTPKGAIPANTKITAQNLPETTLYHGANAETAAKIRAGGFKPSTDMPGYGMVSLTSDAKTAENYANIGGKGEVMQVKIKPGAKIKEYSSMEEYEKAMEATGKKTAGEMESALDAQYDVVIVNSNPALGEKAGQLILAKPDAIQMP